MQRLNIAREDPNIRQAVSASGFRSQQQAMAEAQMMRAAIMAKAVAGAGAAGSPAGAAGPSGAAAGAAAGSPASRMAAYPQQGQGQTSGASPRPFMRTSGAGAAAAGAAAAAAAAPALPYVFRRAAQDVQITDPSTGDILQLDKGTWVMTAAAAGPTRSLAIYTTDADTGSVLSYEVPLPDGRIASLFDQHTLNPLDTVTIGE